MGIQESTILSENESHTSRHHPGIGCLGLSGGRSYAVQSKARYNGEWVAGIRRAAIRSAVHV
jgi:hypothetical protein